MNLRTGYMLFLTAAVVVPALNSCRFFRRSPDVEADVIAKVNDTYLYRKDLEGLIPPGTEPEDSVEKVKNFIDDWVRQTLLLQKAELNLSDKLKSFDKELENYRKTLIIYTYQEMLVSQQLDTTITEEEIRKYYDENPSNFELRQNIVKASYVIFTRANKERDKVRKWFQSDKEDQREKLEKFCRESALKYNLNDTVWMFMDALEKDIPLSYSSQELFLSSKHFVETEDSSLVYLLNIHDYKIKESLSPLEFEKSRIRSIILNIRKRELLRKTEEDIYREAVDEKKFEIYVK